MSLYVAVVDRVGGSYASDRAWGDYAAFVGENREDVIRRALRARDAWSHDDAIGRPRHGRMYRVLVGELTGEAREPVRYEVVPLEEQS